VTNVNENFYLADENNRIFVDFLGQSMSGIRNLIWVVGKSF